MLCCSQAGGGAAGAGMEAGEEGIEVRGSYGTKVRRCSLPPPLPLPVCFSFFLAFLQAVLF